jgi:glutamate synthase domain-containing protein 3
MGHMAETIYSTKDINRAIRAQIKKGATTRIEGLTGQDNIAVGLKSEAKITIVGEAGDFFGALNDGTTLLLRGGSGRYLGDSLLSGKIIVEGDVSHGAGANMQNGEIIVKGDAGQRVGVGMKGGVLIIDGDVEDELGLQLFDGDILITGDAGKDVGKLMTGGNIFVNGKIRSLGENAMSQKPSKNDKLKLTNYLTKQNLLGEFKFKKVTSERAIPLHTIINSFGLTLKKAMEKNSISEDIEE